MYGAVATFDEIERKSGETKGWALLAKNARHRIAIPVLLGFVSYTLKGLVDSLTPERLEQLSAEDALSLTKSLQELHSVLAGFSRLYQSGRIPKLLGIASLVEKIELSTEDLADIIEDLALANNDQFKELVSGCVAHVTAAHSGRM